MNLRSRVSSFLNARRLARTSKRLDICAAQVAHLLHLAALPSFQGKTCVELGCGSVMSHALVFHLLGASRVYAVDVVRMANAGALKAAVRAATPSIVRDILSPFSDHEELRARVDRLMAWDDYSAEGLVRLGISYLAPRDLAQASLGLPVDFVYSNSVLEHIPPAEVAGVLANVTADLRPGGAMIHAVHLEDHRDHARRPFDFLAMEGGDYPPPLCYSRGNRLRGSSWRAVFSSLPSFDTTVLYEWRRPAELLPDRVSKSVENEGKDDLRISHLGLLSRRSRSV